MNKTDIVAIIPARYASTRLPSKPLIDLLGKPMIQRVYEQVMGSKLINEVIIATDHPEIERSARLFGKVVMTPSGIRSGSDRIALVAQALKYGEIIVNVQGDEPLIPAPMIDAAIRPLLEDETIQMATIAKLITSPEELFDPGIVKVVLDNDNFALYFSRSPIPHIREAREKHEWLDHHRFYKHFGIYVFRKKFLLEFSAMKESLLEKAERLEQLRILENGFKIKVSVTELDSVAVDTPEDAEKVRRLLSKIEGNS